MMIHDPEPEIIITEPNDQSLRLRALELAVDYDHQDVDLPDSEGEVVTALAERFLAFLRGDRKE